MRFGSEVLVLAARSLSGALVMSGCWFQVVYGKSQLLGLLEAPTMISYVCRMIVGQNIVVTTHLFL